MIPVAFAALRVYLAFALPGVFAAPLLRRAFPRLRDGGASIARPAGWALIAWIAWIFPSLHVVPYGTAIVFAATIAVGALGAAVAWQDRAAWRELFRREWKTIAIGEALCAGVYLLGMWLIQFNGDVHPMAERFMDYAIMNRIGLTKVFPPLDSWMAGKTLQYYYYGYVVMDALRRIAFLKLIDFFNPAIPAVFSSFVLAIWGAGLAVTNRRIAAAIAVVGAGFCGNLEFARELLIHRFAQHQWDADHLDWFKASRIIPGTINEVPSFSWFWGDLHPYVMGFPLVAMLIALCLTVAQTPESPVASTRPRADRFLALALLTIPLGATYPTNSWDLPTFWTLTMVALAWPHLASLLALAKKAWEPPNRARAVWLLWENEVVRSLVFVGIGAVLLYVPFHIGFGKQVGRGIRLTIERSDAIPWMLQFGPFLIALELWAIATAKDRAALVRRALPMPAVAAVLAIFETLTVRKILTDDRTVAPGVAAWVAGLQSHGAIAHAVGAGIEHLFLKGLAFLLIVAVLWVLIADLEPAELSTPEGLGRALFAFAMMIVLVCEFAYIDDFYGGKNERMNTVFKAYLQTWMLLGVGTAGLAVGAWQALQSRPRALRGTIAGVAALTAVASLCFITFADYSRSSRFTGTRSAPRPTYDPELLLRDTLPADYRAIEWVKANLTPDAAIAESTANAYEWDSRIATFTGRLSLIGWKNHESGWRNEWDDALQRAKVIDEIYAGDLTTAESLAHQWGLQYLYVGEQERGPLQISITADRASVGMQDAVTITCRELDAYGASVGGGDELEASSAPPVNVDPLGDGRFRIAGFVHTGIVQAICRDGRNFAVKVLQVQKEPPERSVLATIDRSQVAEGSHATLTCEELGPDGKDDGAAFSADEVGGAGVSATPVDANHFEVKGGSKAAFGVWCAKNGSRDAASFTVVESKHPGWNVAKFEAWPKVYSNERVTLYQVPPATAAATPAAAAAR